MRWVAKRRKRERVEKMESTGEFDLEEFIYNNDWDEMHRLVEFLKDQKAFDEMLLKLIEIAKDVKRPGSARSKAILALQSFSVTVYDEKGNNLIWSDMMVLEIGKNLLDIAIVDIRSQRTSFSYPEIAESAIQAAYVILARLPCHLARFEKNV